MLGAESKRTAVRGWSHRGQDVRGRARKKIDFRGWSQGGQLLKGVVKEDNC